MVYKFLLVGREVKNSPYSGILEKNVGCELYFIAFDHEAGLVRRGWKKEAHELHELTRII